MFLLAILSFMNYSVRETMRETVINIELELKCKNSRFIDIVDHKATAVSFSMPLDFNSAAIAIVSCYSIVILEVNWLSWP